MNELEQKKPRVLLVLGMHRSGTSATTRVVNLLGAALGDNLIAPAADNPDGFWEHADVVSINDDLLKSLGRTWYDMRELPKNWTQLESSQRARSRIGELMSREFAGASRVVIKDPRMCLTSALWIDTLNELGYEVSSLFVVRDPREVVNSLHVRNKWSREPLFLMWVQYVIEAAAGSRGSQRAMITFDQLLDDWALTMKRVAGELAIDWNDGDLVEQDVNAFLKKGNKHHVAKKRAAASDASDEMPLFAVDVYETCLGIATGQKGWADLEPFERRYKSVSGLYAARMDELLNLRWDAESRVQHAEAKLASASLLGDEIAQKVERIVTSSLDKRLTHVATLEKALERKELQVQQLLTSRSWRFTAPLRWVAAGLSPTVIRRFSGRSLRWFYSHLPVSQNAKQRFKSAVFRFSAPVIKNTNAYRSWRDQAGNVAGIPAEKTFAEGATKVLLDLQRSAVDTDDEYVPFDDAPVDHRKLDVRAIAFYLPQFHPIPENDAWWGKGFTEWTNVAKAVPQFVGHYQPHLPGELGFYDLRLVDVMRRQVELARHYGIHGFCFHYYWFAGKRLLERPLNQFLAHRDIDFPFCICWANENWTRRWDGQDQELLIAQDHSPADDQAFIAALEPLLRDPRYIKVGGKPLIVLYRPSILPDAAATIRRWREHCQSVGIGEIFVAMAQFDVDDPRVFGLDAAIEFPPHKLARGLGPINQSLQIVNPDYAGHVIDYGSIVERARDYEADYDVFRGVFPSWDNEARKPGKGYTFADATPARYREWLELALDYARRKPVANERLVFINAWNEWAEGAHLEPDRRYGYAFLNATRAALRKRATSAAKRIVIVSHDAHPHGAQYLALNMARMCHDVFHFSVDIVLLGDGQLKDEFSRVGRVHDLAGKNPLGDEAKNLAASLRAAGVRHAIANTTVSGLFAQTLKQAGFKVVSLVHELPGVIRDNNLAAHAASLAQHSDCVVFPAEPVRAGFAQFAQVQGPKSAIRAQGLYKLNRYAGSVAQIEARKSLRQELGIPATATIVLCVGYADARKGADLFVEIGRRVMTERPDTHFLWVGHFEASMRPALMEAVASSGYRDRFHFPGRKSDTDLYYAGADVYALTSREDPFPSVVMEAMQVGVPVIGFRSVGGFEALLDEGTGIAVAHGDVHAFASAALQLLGDTVQAQALAQRGRTIVEERFDFRAYLFDLLDMADIKLPRVSVVVPNYNYARYLPQRLGTIIDQSYPFYELIVLDDRSTDNSLQVIGEVAAKRSVHIKTIANDSNSGSVFRQWARGVELARGDYVWIAEADDLSNSEFLSSLLPLVDDQKVVMAYCQSSQIDERGNLIADHYRAYTDDVSAKRWLSDYRNSGLEEIRTCLVVKNTIPNVSSVLFRRKVLQPVLQEKLEEMCSFRVAGDWVAYLAVLEHGDVAYVADALNQHRRHRLSVTVAGMRLAHMLEVLRVQGMARARYEPPAESLERARKYLDSLYLHFDFTLEEIARVEAEASQVLARSHRS